MPYQLVLVTGLIGVTLELFGLINRGKLLRRICYVAMIPFTAFSVTVLLALDLRLATVLILVVAVFRIMNAIRVTEGRMKEPRLFYASRRTSLWLLGLQLVSFGWWRLIVWQDIQILPLLYGFLAVSFVASVVLLISTQRTLKKTQFNSSDTHLTDSELPSVSICIPARNETADLSSCLESLLKSDYPKLEILVLDDCSQDKTSEIIKGFAHDGVRFLAGEPPQKDWLAKNQAYQALAEAASGEILLFCGVDVRVGRNAVRTLVGSMLGRQKQMISLLPKGLQIKEHANLLQPMRYWWELALPRRLFNRPPVLSTVWIISRQAFFGRGEMKAVKGSVIPEAYFARELARNDEYSFMRSSGKLDVSTAKQLPDQWQTALRTRYPRLRKRPENVLLVLFAELWLFVLPIGLFLLGFFVNLGLLWLLAGIVTIVLLHIHRQIMTAWGVKQTSLSLALFPVAVLLEMTVTKLSMIRYEFSEVSWKDRNICIPVMHHYKRLPKI